MGNLRSHPRLPGKEEINYSMEPFGFSEKYVQKFMEKERKEVRDYSTSHTSDVS